MRAASPSTGSPLMTANSSPKRGMRSWRRGFRCRSGPPWLRLRDGELVGFAVMRRSAAASRVGPLFAATPDIAGSLVSALAQKTGSAAVAIDVPDRNKAAVKLAVEMGLKPSFETARMYTGADPDVNYAGLFGVTSLELGWSRLLQVGASASSRVAPCASRRDGHQRRCLRACSFEMKSLRTASRARS